MSINANQIDQVAAMLTNDPDVLVENVGTDAEEDAFLNSIMQAPDDSAPRLIFADWLDEQEDPRADAYRRFGRSGDPMELIGSIVARPTLSWAKLVDSDVIPSDPIPEAPNHDFVENVDITIKFRISKELAMLLDVAQANNNQEWEDRHQQVLEVLGNAAAAIVDEKMHGTRAAWHFWREGDLVTCFSNTIDFSEHEPDDDDYDYYYNRAYR